MTKAVSGNSIAVFTIGFDIHHTQLDDQHSTVSTYIFYPRGFKNKELVFSFKRAYNLEVILVMVERKCPKGDSWNKARCKQIELHYTEVKCLWRGTEVRKASVFNKDLSGI
ncbi:hypothetical protein LOTGIDRAFT_167662 [Lottia gigantea]|uniref:Uncharacterized protein n=1 Tax=Lottia gigantea TaxID=225164 RepID=V4BAD4_LOTGI|nr:hypothetical protein LOTGIDRAFT_167662 [Lottia gigantea]ESO85904.1 hypothetical protein LOTGIDRAFT_167662 [Lottia gigantea]